MILSPSRPKNFQVVLGNLKFDLRVDIKSYFVPPDLVICLDTQRVFNNFMLSLR